MGRNIGEQVDPKDAMHLSDLFGELEVQMVERLMAEGWTQREAALGFGWAVIGRFMGHCVEHGMSEPMVGHCVQNGKTIHVKVTCERMTSADFEKN